MPQQRRACRRLKSRYVRKLSPSLAWAKRRQKTAHLRPRDESLGGRRPKAYADAESDFLSNDTFIAMLKNIIRERIHNKHGKIGLKDYWESFIISYKIKKRTISQKIYKQENIREQISWFLIDVYFEYEFNWEPMTEEKIWMLLMIDQGSTSRLLDKILSKMQNKSKIFTSCEL